MTFFSPVIKQNTPTNVCLTRTKQISSELVCGNSFVKILCTYFFLYKFGSLAANVPAWEHSCILESVDQIELKFCKNFKGIERDFLVPAGKRLINLIPFSIFAQYLLFFHPGCSGMCCLTWATARSQQLLFVVLAASLWCFTAGWHVKSPLLASPNPLSNRIVLGPIRKL